MTTYRLQDELSYCFVDERPILLDIRNDRYFCLSGAMERAFTTFAQDGCCSPAEIAHLVEQNIVTGDPYSGSTTSRSIPIASLSAVELTPNRATCGLRTALETMAIVCWTQTQLKTRRLMRILSDTTTRQLGTLSADDRAEPRLVAAAHAFLQGRKFVPIETCCLLDSLAMVSFLARRQLRANIVFGVTGDPFSAHCWVQAGRFVLNDTIGNTRAYTVIRVI